ncbi:MAG: Pyridoxamine 5'-phosphate oxidase [Chloroflexi bacterium ADurb.Bin360]|nr:MAG: Pyridoxamine 5'-phosphate oxidase [Chloroflexi bacterium ADurb.Bin360]
MKVLSEEKRQFVDTFLARPLIARMATAGTDGRPHVVPVWYAWDGTALWISSFVSTRKIRQLRENSYLSVSVDVSGAGEKTSGVILEGAVELVTEPRELVAQQSTWIYARYLGEAGVLAEEPQSWIHDPENLLIKLTPEEFFVWEY